jgi:outer membrane protein TolC
MYKPLKLMIFFLWGLPLLHVYGASALEISEKSLVQLAEKGAPRLDEIQSAFLASEVRYHEKKEDFAPELFGKGSYSETQERALIQFQPIFSPVKQAQLGVRKKFQYGVTTSAAVSADQRSAGTTGFTGKFDNATTTVLSFSVQMDLWKDLFGRLEKTKLQNLALESRKSELEREIQIKSFKLSLRRTYWSLVANAEALKISQALLDTAKSQSSDTQKRFKNAVAEADEVARYRAQVASREGTLLYLKYQREALTKQLKNLLPELATADITLAKYDLNQTLESVLACTATVAAEKDIPYHFTKYDEVTTLLKKIKSNSRVINSRYADADVKLFGTVKATGVGSEQVGAGSPASFVGSYGSAWDDMSSTNRSGYEVGVAFTLPLGKVKETTQKTKELYDDKRLDAAINSSNARVINTHTELIQSTRYLADVIKSQKTNSEELQKRLKFSRRKYEQARVSVSDLVNDQDALLSAQLTTIDTQLQILNVLFDYLAIYTDTPCPFNRI